MTIGPTAIIVEPVVSCSRPSGVGSERKLGQSRAMVVSALTMRRASDSRRSEGIVDTESPLGLCLDEYPVEPRRLTDSDTAAVAKALGHPTRLEILELFHVRCPRTVGDISAELPLAQSTISNHLRILRDAGVVRTLRPDIRAFHCLNRSVLAGFAEAVSTLARTTRGVRDPFAETI